MSTCAPILHIPPRKDDPDLMIQPFTITVPDADLTDLHRRLAQTRWPRQLGDGWQYGTNLSYTRELIEYWRDDFDWRARERELNAFPQFRAAIDGVNIHFIHARGNGSHPLPLILTHGWPSSFFEMLKLVPLLTDPARFGGDPADAFDVVIPSFPGYGFSDAPPAGGMQRARIAEIWKRLMVEVLGYERFGAHGGDVGGGVTDRLGRYHAEHIVGLHLVDISTMPYEGSDAVPLTENERAYFVRIAQWDEADGAYAHMQATRPQTLAYGLNDSPAGLATWIIEKFREWSDCDGDIERAFTRDELLTTISIYWHTQSIASSFGPYFVRNNDRALLKDERITVPVGFALFPKNIEHPPHELADRIYNTVLRWKEMPRGGHFPALEVPDLLAEEIRAFFRPLRAV